eukprot:UN3308
MGQRHRKLPTRRRSLRVRQGCFPWRSRRSGRICSFSASPLFSATTRSTMRNAFKSAWVLRSSARRKGPMRPMRRRRWSATRSSSSSIRATGSHMARGETANAGFWTAHLLVGAPHEDDSWMPCLGFAACLGRPAPVAQAQPLQASLT